MKINNQFRKSLKSGLIISLLLFVVFQVNIEAQQNITGEISKTYTITMKDGSTISGKLTSMSENEVVIQSATLGVVTLQKTNIRSMEAVSSIDEKESGIWFPNPNPSKYLLGNSAIPLEKGSGYYQNTWVFINSFGYAFTDNFSMSGGFEIFSIMAGGEGPFVFFLNPKASFKVVDNLYLGGNILYVNTIRSIDDFKGLGTLNGFMTYGNNNNNLTAALGWGWANGEFSSKPVITVSGMTRVAKRLALVSENWFVPELGDSGGYYGILSYGIRFLGEKTSIDLAFINNPDIASEIIIGIPWLDFSIRF